MPLPIRTLRCVLLAPMLLAAGACGNDDGAPEGDGAVATAAAPAATPRSDEEDLADISEYRLTMDKYDKYLAAQRNLAQKFKSMSPAEREAMEARNEGQDNQNASLDDMVRNFEREPMINQAIRDAGLSAREYAMFTMSMMQTAMAAGVAKMRPNDNQDSLIREMEANPENVKFLQANEAEITRKQNELAAEMKRLGLTEEDS